MKIQNMAIILIIIILPIVLLLGQYTKVQIDTIVLQSQYTTKLKDATHDAVEAFQLNTVHNEFSTVSDSMRRDVRAAIDVFTSTLAQNLGVEGATSNYIMPYIPAIVFTLYDGYYIYAPSYNYTELNEERLDAGYKLSGDVFHRSDANGSGITQISTEAVRKDLEQKNANREQLGKYEHVLKPYVYYTVRYAPSNDTSTDFIVNYSLDNYVVIYGMVKGEYVTKSGYLVAPDEKERMNVSSKEVLKKVLPVTTLTFTDNQENTTNIDDQAIIDVSLQKVEITNQALLVDRLNTGYYPGSSVKISEAYSEKDAEKTYKMPENKVLLIKKLALSYPPLASIYGNFSINDLREFLTVNSGSTVEITINDIESNTGLQKAYYDNNEYNNLALKTGEKTILERYKEGTRRISWFVGADVGKYEGKSTDYYVEEDSASKYYDNANELTTWVIQNLSDICAKDAIKPDGKRYEGFGNEKIFDVGTSNDPDIEYSRFNEHKREVIKRSIQDNLSQAIASYSEHSEALNTTYDYRMPILSDTEWDQVLKNVCMITFMQGLKAGTKTYNNYTIVTSTRNKEFVSPDELYFINEDDNPNNNYYHKINCSHLADTNIVGYRNIDFDTYSFDVEDVPQITKNDEGQKAYDYSTGTKGSLKTIDRTTYYYRHSEKVGNNYKPYEACYYCLVNSTKEGNSVDWRNNTQRRGAYYTALAREKYNFYKTNSYLNTDENGVNIDNYFNILEAPKFDGLKAMGMFNQETGEYGIVYYEIFENGTVDYSKYRRYNQETKNLENEWIY